MFVVVVIVVVVFNFRKYIASKQGNQLAIIKKNVTLSQQKRPESPTATLTWHASKYKVPALHQSYILTTLMIVSGGFVPIDDGKRDEQN